MLNRFLIVRTDRMGDVLLTLPMARVIKKHRPYAHICMMIQQYTSEIVRSDKNVDELLIYDENGKMAPFFQLIEKIRRGNYNVVFHTNPRFLIALITWLAGIPVRVGTGYRWYSFLFTKKIYEHRKNARYHELEYNVHLLRSIDFEIEGIDISPKIDIHPEWEEKIENYLNKLNVGANKKIIIIHPGSGKSARDWSPKNFGLLAKKISGIENFQVIITGSPTEKPLVDFVSSLAGNKSIPSTEGLSFGEFSALIKKSSLFISNSTGPIHIAAAVGTTVIGLYPHIIPLSEKRWGPWTDKKIIFSPQNKPLNCKKCLKPKSQICECMDSISVESVFDAVMNLSILK